MGLLDFWRPKPPEQQAAALPAPRAAGEAVTFYSLDDPRLIDFMRAGAETASGAVVTVEQALKNTTVFRCVSLIACSIGMLPIHLLRGGENFETNKADDHPLYDLLYVEPNNWQTAFDFKAQMQFNALVHGNAYAMVVRSMGRVVRLVPLDPCRVAPQQGVDLSVSYRYTRPDGGTVTLNPEEVFHLRGLARDGISGTSLVKVAAEAIGLALRTEEAAARLFRNGAMVGGVLVHPGKLGPEALANIRQSLEERYSGAENAHKWMITEEGMEPKPFAPTAADSQHIETRKHQIEEIARAFGVPRPLLGVDDTSWGTGIEQLGIGFVRYGLSPWFTAWEQAITRTLLVGAEKKGLKAKFNEGALLRGSMKDQAEFFAKALGAGGQPGWMKANEVRRLSNLPDDPDGNVLNQGSMGAKSASGTSNEPAQAA